MADFCQQCSDELFGKDSRDMAGLVTPEQWVEGLAATVLCEGCGLIQVDPEGRCVSEDCPKHGTAAPSRPSESS